MQNKKEPEFNPEGEWQRGFGNAKEIYECNEPNMDYDKC